MTGCASKARTVNPAPADSTPVASAEAATNPPPAAAAKAGGVEQAPVAETVRQAAPAAPYTKAVTEILTRNLKPTPQNSKHPGYAGAVALAMVDGKITMHTAVGMRCGTPPGRRNSRRPSGSPCGPTRSSTSPR
jgi:hypothetical protein